MTTKLIREALEKFKYRCEPSCKCCKWDDRDAYEAALEAVAVIEQMARTLVNSTDMGDLMKASDMVRRIAKEAP